MPITLPNLPFCVWMGIERIVSGKSPAPLSHSIPLTCIQPFSGAWRAAVWLYHWNRDCLRLLFNVAGMLDPWDVFKALRDLSEDYYLNHHRMHNDCTKMGHHHWLVDKILACRPKLSISMGVVKKEVTLITKYLMYAWERVHVYIYLLEVLGTHQHVYYISKV